MGEVFGCDNLRRSAPGNCSAYKKIAPIISRGKIEGAIFR